MAEEDSKHSTKSKKRRKTDDDADDDGSKTERKKTKHKRQKTEGDVDKSVMEKSEDLNGEGKIKKKKKEKKRVKEGRKEEDVAVNGKSTEKERSHQSSKVGDHEDKKYMRGTKKKEKASMNGAKKKEKQSINGTEKKEKKKVKWADTNGTHSPPAKEHETSPFSKISEGAKSPNSSRPKKILESAEVNDGESEAEAKTAAHEGKIRKKFKNLDQSGDVESTPLNPGKKVKIKARGEKYVRQNGVHTNQSKLKSDTDDSEEEEEIQSLPETDAPTSLQTPILDLPPELDQVGPADLPLKMLPNSPSGLYQITASMYLPVPPVAVTYTLDGSVANSVTPLLLRYYPPLRGFILGFGNVRAGKSGQAIADPLAHIIDEYSSSFMWATIDFTIFRPNGGIFLEGEVTVHSASHLSLVVWNFFTASVERKRLPRGWKWIVENPDEHPENQEKGDDTNEMDEENAESLTAGEAARKRRRRMKLLKEGRIGSWYDSEGGRVEGTLVFRARDFDITLARGAEVGMLSIEGSLVSQKRDAEIDEADMSANI
jgi:DNA-directed RNA polymerase I subunit RPA43